MTTYAYGADERLFAPVPMSVVTGSAAVAANVLVPVDTTSGAVTITLPSAPNDGSVVVVLMVKQGGSNAVTVASSGTDVFNIAAGATSFTIGTVMTGAWWRYCAVAGIWYEVANISAGGGAAVSSVFGRTGAVVAATSDYSFAQISGTISTGQVPTLNQNTTGTAAGLSATLAIASGGTGQSGAVAAFNALSPSTTLGDILSNDGTNDVRVAGNTTATKKYLIQTGTGAVSALPTWAAIAAGDVPTLNQSTTGNAATASNATAVGGITVTGTPSSGQVLTATSSTAADWQASGSAPVSSVFGRTGAVVAATNDYSFSQISGTAALSQGGTGATSQAAALTAIAGSATLASLVSDLNNATTRSATATLLPGEETIFTGSTASQTLTLPSSSTAISSSVNTVTNTASVSVTVAAGSSTTISNFGTAGSITIPSGYTFALVYIGTTWYVQSAGPSDFAKNSALAIGNGGTGQTTQQAAINTLAGAVTSGLYLRGGGTNVTMAAIQAADVPTLNQATTGNAATATNLSGGATFPAYTAPKVSTLTDASTVAINAALGNDFRLTMTSGVGSTRALGAPSNPVDGQRIDIMVTQDSSGSQLLTYNAAFEFSTGLPSPTLSTGASLTDILGFIYNGTKSKWFFVAFLNGFS